MPELTDRQREHNEKAEREFFSLAQRENIDLSDMDREIAQIFFSREEHLSLRDIRGLLSEKGLDPGQDVIKGAMEILKNLGFAREGGFDEHEERLFEHRHLTEHHDHMFCIKCKKIIEFFVPEIEEMQAQVAAAHHFHALNHRLHIYGICGDCLGKREPLIPLSLASPGERLIVKDIRGGEHLYLKLAAMGLHEGAEIEVITSAGQVIVAVKNTRLAIGRGMAAKIYVGLK